MCRLEKVVDDRAIKGCGGKREEVEKDGEEFDDTWIGERKYRWKGWKGKEKYRESKLVGERR